MFADPLASAHLLYQKYLQDDPLVRLGLISL